MKQFLEYALYLVILVGLAIPLGIYIDKVMNNEKTWLSKLLNPIEAAIYKCCRIHPKDQMTWKEYLSNVIILLIVGFIFLVLLLMFQGFLPLNPLGLKGVKFDLAFNTALSYITNTNWQAYSGENTLSYLSQSVGLTVQNFVSAATGIAVLYTLIRGFKQTGVQTIGNYFSDMVKIILHILIPLNIVISILLVSSGVMQNYSKPQYVSLLEPIAVYEDGTIIENAKIDVDSQIVTLDHQVIKDAKIITQQIVPMGPVASQIAIKQSGTNGGGYFGANSANPLENPNILSNLIEMISILLLPVALCFSFGRGIKNRKQGLALFMSMFILLTLFLGITGYSEQKGTSYQDNPLIQQNVGNMEGKEARFGIVSSSTWATFTTAASSGSVNSMHDSLTPMSGFSTMLLMQLGEVVFGGAGSGLYGLIAFVFLTVFIAGLMVGRTPEFLGKKVDPFIMKWAVVICLATPFTILVGSSLGALLPGIHSSVTQEGAHGFSQLLYAFTSTGANNGSAFAGFIGNTFSLNILFGLMMLLSRLLPIIGTILIASHLSKKQLSAVSVGTLPTHNLMFVGLLVFVILLIGALSFFPALALGPIAEQLNQLF